MEVSQTMLNVGACVLAGVIAYLLGSISFAIIVSRIYAHDDVRKYGSKNAGMTNILRTYGKMPAFFTLLGDFLKGVSGGCYWKMDLFDLWRLQSLTSGHLAGFFALVGPSVPDLFWIQRRQRCSYLFGNYTGCKSTGIFYPFDYLFAGFVYHKNCFVGFGYWRTALSVCYIDR